MNLLAKSLTVIFATATMLSVTLANAENGARGGGALLGRSKQPEAVNQKSVIANQNHRMSSCEKCQTVAVLEKVKEGKGNVTRLVPSEQHLCPTCKTTVKSTGHGKARQDAVVHVCQETAGKAGSCCVK